MFKKLLHGKRKSALLNLTWSGLLCRVVWSVSQLLYLLQRAGHFKFFSPSFFVGLELVNLKITDIDAARMTLCVKRGKGGKDRYAILSQNLLVELRQYWKRYRPSIWLFPNRAKNGP